MANASKLYRSSSKSVKSVSFINSRQINQKSVRSSLIDFSHNLQKVLKQKKTSLVSSFRTTSMVKDNGGCRLKEKLKISRQIPPSKMPCQKRQRIISYLVTFLGYSMRINTSQNYLIKAKIHRMTCKTCNLISKAHLNMSSHYLVSSFQASIQQLKP